MTDTVNLQDTAPTGTNDLVSLDEGTTRQLPDDVAKKRATRADYGLGDNSPGRDALSNAISSGQENVLRDTAAAAADEKEQAAAAKRQVGIVSKTTPLTQDDVDLYKGSQNPTKIDPGVVFELGYGQRIVNDLSTARGDSSAVMNKALRDDPQGTMDKMDAASTIIAKQGVVDRLLEDKTADWKATSWWDAAPDLAESFVPLLSAARLRNVAGVEGGILPGDNLEAQVQGLLLLPPSQFKSKLEEVSDALYAKNPMDAIKFLQAVKSYGADDSYLDSIMGVADAAGIVEGGVGVAKLAGKLAGRSAANSTLKVAERNALAARTALRDTVKAAAKNPDTPEDIFAAVGQVEKAADIGALRKVGILPTDGMTDAEVLARNLPSAARVNTIVSDAGTLSREATDRLAAKLTANLTGVDEALGVTVRNSRMDPNQLAVAIDEAKSSLRREFEKTVDGVIDVKQEVKLPPIDDITANLMDEVSNGGDPNLALTLIRSGSKKDNERLVQRLIKNNRRDALEVLSRGLVDDARTAAAAAKANPTKALVKAAKEAEERAKGIRDTVKGLPPEYKTVKQTVQKPAENIIDIRHNSIESSKANVETMTIDLGAPNATPFPTEDLAHFHANEMYRLMPDSYSVAQVGDSYVIRVERAMDETLDSIRNASIETLNTDNAEGIGSFVDFLRQPNKVLPAFLKGADESLPEFQNAQRKASQYGFNQTLGLLKEMVQPVAALGKAEKRDLEKVLKYNRDYFNSKTGDRGFFYETVGDLENGYWQVTGRLPTEKEVEAYFTYTQISDLDWGFRNYSLYRDKARLGLKQYSFEYMKVDDTGTSFPRSPNFEGKAVDNLPWSGEPATVMHVKNGGRDVDVFDTKHINPDEYIRLIKEEGYKVIQVDNPVERPFKDLLKSNEIIQYVLTKESKESGLSFKQLDYNPGGHVEYQHDWFLKQPRISVGRGGQRFYEGDTAILNFSSEAQTKKFERAFNTAREMLKGKAAGLEEYVSKNLPYTVDQFKALFEGDEALSLDAKFHTTKRGRSVIDDHKYIRTDNPGIRDYTDSAHNLSGEADRKFVGARNGPLMTVHSTGSDSNPVLRFAPAKNVDPLQTMGRSLSNAVNNRFFGDYKIGAVEDFVNRYADAMKTPVKDLRDFPMYFLHNPEWNEGLPAYGKVAEAKNARRAILNFIGEQTPLGRYTESLKQKLFNSVYGTFGEDVTTKLVDKLSPKSGEVIDPAGYFRAIGFHTKLGMFNPMQYVLQAMGATHAIALSPKHGLMSTAAYMPTRWLGLHPSEELIANAAQKMKSVGWNPEHFSESVKAMRQVGYDNVGHEHVWKDNIADPKVFNNPNGTVLDKGAFFFNEGEKANRIITWHTAYREWREANPLRNLDSEALRGVINRADLLGLNMTRASAASWQKGLFSIPTQFLAYNARMMDQFLGKRLTMAEKARAFTAYSMMWGIPSAMSVTGYTFYDDIQQAALERGWPKDNLMVQALTKGVPSMMVSLITGQEYNVAERYGPGGLKQVKDALTGDKSFMEILGGASGSVASDIYGAASPLLSDFYENMKEGGRHEPILQDVLDATRNISSVNAATKVVMALNAGKYYSKSGRLVGDMTGTDAIVGALTGVQPQGLSDAYVKAKSLKESAEAEKAVFKEWSYQMRLGAEASARGDKEGALAFYKKGRAALIAGDINPVRQGLLLQRFLKDSGSMVDNTDAAFINNAPQSQFNDRNRQRINN